MILGGRKWYRSPSVKALPRPPSKLRSVLSSRANNSSTTFLLFRAASQPMLRASPIRKQVRKTSAGESPNTGDRSDTSSGHGFRTIGGRACSVQTLEVGGVGQFVDFLCIGEDDLGMACVMLGLSRLLSTSPNGSISRPSRSASSMSSSSI